MSANRYSRKWSNFNTKYSLINKRLICVADEETPNMVIE